MTGLGCRRGIGGLWGCVGVLLWLKGNPGFDVGICWGRGRRVGGGGVGGVTGTNEPEDD